MAKNWKYILFVILLLIGIYMLTDHYPPLPFNHEQMGLGANHMAHRGVGILFILASIFVFWKRKKA